MREREREREREKGSLSLLSEESSNTGNTKQQKTGTDYRDQRTIVNGVCNVHHLISSNGPDLASLYTIWIYDCIQLVEMSEIALPQGFVKFWECIAYVFGKWVILWIQKKKKMTYWWI